MTDASSLTVAKLKALCVLHDLPTSGVKAVLVERLLEAGLDRSSIGLPDLQTEDASEEAEVFVLELMRGTEARGEPSRRAARLSSSTWALSSSQRPGCPRGHSPPSSESPQSEDTVQT